MTGSASTVPGRVAKTISARSSLHDRNRSRSDAGTPSSSAITVAGSGPARSSLTSSVPDPSTASSSSSVSATTVPARFSTRRGVKAVRTGSRRRV